MCCFYWFDCLLVVGGCLRFDVVVVGFWVLVLLVVSGVLVFDSYFWRLAGFWLFGFC